MSLEKFKNSTVLDPKIAKRVHKELGDEKVIDMYREMILLRRFEEVAGRQYQMGKIKGFCHLYIGQEALAVGAKATLEDRDYTISAYREHGHAIVAGITPNAVMAELFGKVDGCSGGRGGSMHLFDTTKNFYGGWGIVGGHIPTAAGMAFASKYNNEDAVTMCYFGDGSLHQGVFHETLNMAAMWDLPCVFITENNHYAMGTSLDRHSAITDLQKKAVGYDMDHDCIDGQDVFAVYEGIKKAVDRARKKNRPTFLDIITYRYRGHSMSDPAKYRTKDELNDAQEVGPIIRLQNFILKQKIADKETLDAIDKDVKKIVKESVKFAEASPFPDPSTLTDHTYVEWNSPID